jgi:LuxR family maltose regulon positive regulatory protein
LFLVPLDNERHWYRYHHLFADLLRQRLQQSLSSNKGVAELHIQASAWYESNGLDVEAFHHATAANDVARAERLIEGDSMPLHFRGALAPVLNWLTSLSTDVLDTYPSLWTTYASVLLAMGQPTTVPQKLEAAEAALQDAEPTDKNRDLLGRVAAIRATLAANQRQVETIITQSRVALEYLHPDNQAFRTFTIWKLGYAYQLQGDRAAARQAYADAITDSELSGNTITTILATTGLASVQETDNQLELAMQNYQRALQLIADLPLPVASEAHLGMARIFYEWNDLNAAQQSIQRAQQVDNNNRFISCAVLLARVKLAQGDVEGAAAHIAEATHYVRQHDFNFVHRIPELVAAQVLTYLRQGNLAAASDLAQTHNLPMSQARVCLAQGDAATALELLEPLRWERKAKGWTDEQLRVMVLQVVAYHAHEERSQALQLLADALTLAAPSGLMRSFIDEGLPMAELVSEVHTHGLVPHYVEKLRTQFGTEAQQKASSPSLALPAQELVEPLSQRELEVLQLVAQGFSNREIGKRLFLAINTVKGHNRNIFGKLQVQRRTEAIARARAIGLL